MQKPIKCKIFIYFFATLYVKVDKYKILIPYIA